MADDDRGLRRRWGYRLGRGIEPGDVWTQQRSKAWWWVAGFLVVLALILLWLYAGGGSPEPPSPA